MRNVVIFGIGQIAEVIHYYLTQEANRNVVAFTVDDQYRSAERIAWIAGGQFRQR